MKEKKRYDAIIVGAGPGGCAAALKLQYKGLSVGVIEKKELNASKSCGGLLTFPVEDLLEEELNLNIPSDVFENPKNLGLAYLHQDEPFGFVRINYHLRNINRQKFDTWLRNEVLHHDIPLYTRCKVIHISRNSNEFLLSVENRESKEKEILTSTYLIGADGINSLVRRNYCGFPSQQRIFVMQERLANHNLKQTFKSYFYIYYDSTLSQFYFYIIPKKQFTIIGGGILQKKGSSPQMEETAISHRLRLAINEFYSFLANKFSIYLQGGSTDTDFWGIPFYSIQTGCNNCMLVGDAAGFAHGWTGEGIRFAIETGIQAAKSISTEPKNPCKAYNTKTYQLQQMIRKTREYSLSFSNTEYKTFLTKGFYKQENLFL